VPSLLSGWGPFSPRGLLQGERRANRALCPGAGWSAAGSRVCMGPSYLPNRPSQPQSRRRGRRARAAPQMRSQPFEPSSALDYRNGDSGLYPAKTVLRQTTDPGGDAPSSQPPCLNGDPKPLGQPGGGLAGWRQLSGCKRPWLASGAFSVAQVASAPSRTGRCQGNDGLSAWVRAGLMTARGVTPEPRQTELGWLAG